ncbi:MAG: NAD(P)H-hydrate epimerase [Phycisphaerae bacterium]|nr:NAD(P)H-hydrate epimerase [Phycisphaerae bacterium]
MNSLTREDVRAIDRYAIEVLGVSGVVLMENAGRNAARELDEWIRHDRRRRVAIVAGAGNNGGDGYVIARHMARLGYDVTTFLVAPEEKITGDARINLDILRKLKYDVQTVNSMDHFAERLREYDAIVDAVGGTGIRGALRSDLAAVVERINLAGKSVLAVDIPTGLDCDTGEAAGPCIQANLTVTFLARKRGFDNPASRPFTGEVVIADIGVDADYVMSRMKG